MIWDIGFGGVSIVVIMKVSMMVYLCFLIRVWVWRILVWMSSEVMIGSWKIRLKEKISVMIRFRYFEILGMS